MYLIIHNLSSAVKKTDKHSEQLLIQSMLLYLLFVCIFEVTLGHTNINIENPGMCVTQVHVDKE